MGSFHAPSGFAQLANRQHWCTVMPRRDLGIQLEPVPEGCTSDG